MFDVSFERDTLKLTLVQYRMREFLPDYFGYHITVGFSFGAGVKPYAAKDNFKSAYCQPHVCTAMIPARELKKLADILFPPNIRFC